ncbi:glycoside hydrolase family 76 protein [Aplosporella prunicola CBS 121167]|uniref:Glycoside hydrolase family 76 protein n=1 Tax=Aplosporella prunicola CBS 121167 TaxID=1176127 RepID=A0A6A6BKU4_9PEZI|nr:glycoside hydrolase family 76 protein [Aplosporella prunicola CBS 121167]KAF2144003.1 glycoside hydrolase family 76 protein [Aplosporella prunicola CBS 121167]
MLVPGQQQQQQQQQHSLALDPLDELHAALATMQSQYFELWLGQWPQAIDWTAAVTATHVSSSLRSLTHALARHQDRIGPVRVENELNRFFEHVVAYYFGEDAFALRMQAYDDMLWVVLGWLEGIKFTREQAALHERRHGARDADEPATQWHGTQFVSAFAHRAHIFYDIARQGWDTRLCGGGMTWNPHLLPYKNAITNELYISASVGMYLDFPGDENTSPFLASGSSSGSGNDDDDAALPPARPHDSAFLRAAQDGYAWLKRSNMTDDAGLYVDGFHITDFGKNGSIGTGKCDERNDMVYTYNQGVLLSGLRGLWESTGKTAYLEDGHALVRSVIAATGWDAERGEAGEAGDDAWHPLGRAGILHDACDRDATCSQDGQTFKGIFFNHFTAFCAPLPAQPRVPDVSFGADAELRSLHLSSCRGYAAWVARNAKAALATRDQAGRFGGWWGAGVGIGEEGIVVPASATDYRNDGDVLAREPWSVSDTDASSEPSSQSQRPPQCPRRPGARRARTAEAAAADDPNDRGRGRTVETQGGGVAVVRALWEFVALFEGEKGESE